MKAWPVASVELWSGLRMKTVVMSIHVQAANAGHGIFRFPARLSLPRSVAENHFGLTTYDYPNVVQSTSE